VRVGKRYENGRDFKNSQTAKLDTDVGYISG
jgi:hypothetical protein